MAFFDFGYQKKLEKIKTYLETGQYEDAALAADQIPEYKVKSAYELNLLGKAYKYNKDFLQAREIFEHSYEVRASRNVLMDIMDCCLAMKDLQAVERYFDEYHKVEPEDKVTLYKYRYRIEKKKGRERRLLIPILEELKALEYIEEYAYELAKQYHRAGMVQECMNECHDIILWFGFGPTVERAKTLLAYYRGEISSEEMKAAKAAAKADEDVKENTTSWNEELQEEEEEAAPTKEASCQTGLTLEPELKSAYERLFASNMAAESDSEKMSRTGQMSEILPKEQTGFGSVQENVSEELSMKRPMEADASEELSMRRPMEADVSEELSEFRSRKETETKSTAEPGFYEPEAEQSEFEIEDEQLKQLLQKSQYSISEVLKNFGRIDRIRRQVIKGLEQAVNDRERTCFIITGEPKTGKTTLAFRVIHLLYEMRVIPYDRTATIDAVQLNQISVGDYEKLLCNCNLVIENAGSMTEECMDGVIEFSEKRKGKICVVLEDSVRDINKSLRSRKELNTLFVNRIAIGKYSSEELLGFAYDYIVKEEYKIETAAADRLLHKIEQIMSNCDVEQQLPNTLELVGQAIDRAEERTGKLLLSMASDGKILNGTYMVLQKEDI